VESFLFIAENFGEGCGDVDSDDEEFEDDDVGDDDASDGMDVVSLDAHSLPPTAPRRSLDGLKLYVKTYVYLE